MPTISAFDSKTLCSHVHAVRGAQEPGVDNPAGLDHDGRIWQAGGEGSRSRGGP